MYLRLERDREEARVRMLGNRKMGFYFCYCLEKTVFLSKFVNETVSRENLYHVAFYMLHHRLRFQNLYSCLPWHWHCHIHSLKLYVFNLLQLIIFSLAVSLCDSFLLYFACVTFNLCRRTQNHFHFNFC